MEVVQLLLERGAIPSLKTDFGETPLDVLQKWRTGNILTKDEETLYNNISNKIHMLIDKTNAAENLNRSKSKTPVKSLRKDVTPPSTSKTTSKIKELASPVFKRRNIIDDESDDEINQSQNVRNEAAFPSDDSNDSSDDAARVSKKKSDISGVKEYRSAISALRNRSATDLDDVETVKKTKQKPALLDPDEVDDDWLDDDLGINKTGNKRRLSDPLTTVAKKPTYESIKDSIDSINQLTEPLLDGNNKTNVVKNKTKSRISDVVNISENSSDSDQFQSNENISPRTSKAIQSIKNISRELNESIARDSRNNMRKRWKTQSTLLKAGFHRKRDEDSSNSGSDNDFSTRTNKDSNRLTPTGSFPRENDFSNRLNKDQNRLTPTSSFSRHSSGENFNYGYQKEGFNIVQNISPSIVQPMNVIQPINIVQSAKNGRTKQTQIVPPAAVKVQVEDKVLLISLKLDTINRLTISWLVDEVKSRYYK